MSAWWVVGIVAVLLLEAALAWRCWRNHRADAPPRIYCLSLNPINHRTGYCRHRRCTGCQHSRKVGALLRATHPEIFSTKEPR